MKFLITHWPNYNSVILARRLLLFEVALVLVIVKSLLERCWFLLDLLEGVEHVFLARVNRFPQNVRVSLVIFVSTLRLQTSIDVRLYKL